MRYILTFVVTLITLSLSAQELPERGLIRRGNRAFNKSEYKGAIEDFDKAHTLAPDSFEATYNYANALLKDEQYAKAEELYAVVKAEELPSDSDRADLFFNLGNSQFLQEKYQEALESYKSSMRADPNDQEAKYNYAYTKKLLEDQQQDQDQNQDENQDENQDDENQDQDQDQDQNDQGDQDQDQGDQDQDEQNQDQNQDQGDQDEQEQDGQEQPSEGRISPQEQAQMLDAIQAQEDKTQEKLEEEAKKGILIPGRKNW